MTMDGESGIHQAKLWRWRLRSPSNGMHLLILQFYRDEGVVLIHLAAGDDDLRVEPSSCSHCRLHVHVGEGNGQSLYCSSGRPPAFRPGWQAQSTRT